MERSSGRTQGQHSQRRMGVQLVYRLWLQGRKPEHSTTVLPRTANVPRGPEGHKGVERETRKCTRALCHGTVCRGSGRMEIGGSKDQQRNSGHTRHLCPNLPPACARACSNPDSSVFPSLALGPFPYLAGLLQVVVLIAMAASTVAIALAAMNGLEKAAGRVEQGLEKAGWQVRQGLVEAGKEHATILSRASLGVGGLIIGLVLFWWRTGNAGGTRPEQGGAATGGTQVPAEGTANGGRRGF